MIVRGLEKIDRPQAEALWRDIFEETPAFAAYYFDCRFHTEYAFGAFDTDRLVAMAHGRPTKIRVNGAMMPALLIAGVATQPEYRRQGLMHRLMTLLIDRAKNCSFSCCYLHPVTETLYASLGFRNGADILFIHSDDSRVHEPFDLTEQFRPDDMLDVYHALQQTHDGMEYRDEAELLTVYRDYAIDGAKTMIAYRNGRPVGYIIWCGGGLVYELMAWETSAYAFLIDEAAKRTGHPIKAMVPTDCGLEGERHYSMQYLVFSEAFGLPLKNGFCRLAY